MKEKNPPQSGNAKALYIGMAGILIALLGYAVWGVINQGALSHTALIVKDIAISKETLLANGQDASNVTLTINAGENLPAIGIWVGLKIDDESKASETFSYFGWYSPEPNRSFYQTDGNGQVAFTMKSDIPGDISYSVYAADPTQKNANKYQSLSKKFTLHFQSPEAIQ